MSKIFAGKNFQYRNWKSFKLKELIFAIEYCSFLLKSLSLSFTFYVPKNTIIWTINESAKNDRKLGDYSSEEVDVKYIFLKGNVKKSSNYVWRKSFITWIFAVYFAGIKFSNYPKRRKTSKFSTLENFWHWRIILKFGLRNPDLGGFLGGSFCDNGKYLCIGFTQHLKTGAS